MLIHGLYLTYNRRSSYGFETLGRSQDATKDIDNHTPQKEVAQMMTVEERAKRREEARARRAEQERLNLPKVKELAEALEAAGITRQEWQTHHAMIIVAYGDFDRAVQVQNEVNNGVTVARRI